METRASSDRLRPTYRRVLLKMSGQSLQGRLDSGIDHETVTYVASQIQGVRSMGVEVAVAIGGGNIWRGETAASIGGIDRATADYMGMLATVINALALKGALERLEVGAEVLLMAKNNVDGVYTDDPNRNPAAKRYEKLSYIDALAQGLEVMDSTALSLCMDNKLPIIVFDLLNPTNLERLIRGDEVGTLIS